MNPDLPRAKEVRAWFDSLDKDYIDISPLSIGSGLESLLKVSPKDETLRRFCSKGGQKQQYYINPEDTMDRSQLPEDDDEDKNVDMDQFKPSEAAKKSYNEKFKTEAIRYYAKFNSYQQKQREKEEGVKRRKRPTVLNSQGKKEGGRKRKRTVRLSDDDEDDFDK